MTKGIANANNERNNEITKGRKREINKYITLDRKNELTHNEHIHT